VDHLALRGRAAGLARDVTTMQSMPDCHVDFHAA
jgi:hypothetical protein